MIDYPIDLVVPFVDNTDPVGRKTFEDFCKQHGHIEHLADLNGERFDNPGLFNYGIKCVEKFMPWIRKIHLIVSNKEQVPTNFYSSNKLHVVLHKDFIPEKYLPTFNSTTIEMFMPFIPDLAEHFIYSNDDMFPIRKLTPEHFFAEDGRIRITMRYVDVKKSKDQFKQVCRNNYQDVLKALNQPIPAQGYLRPFHSMCPMIKSHVQECGDLLHEDLLLHATAFRTEKQHNQYIYPIYETLKYTVANNLYIFTYTSLQLGSAYIANLITGRKCDILCINDVKIPNRKKFQWQNIKDAFETILS